MFYFFYFFLQLIYFPFVFIVIFDVWDSYGWLGLVNEFFEVFLYVSVAAVVGFVSFTYSSCWLNVS